MTLKNTNKIGKMWLDNISQFQDTLNNLLKIILISPLKYNKIERYI